MYVVHYHNEHAFDNPGECAVYGPYETRDEAKAGLARLAATVDPCFQVDPNNDPNAKGTYAGFDDAKLEAADRDVEIAAEIWAEVVELTPRY